MREYRCPICGVRYPAKDPHRKTTHKEFDQWYRRLRFKFVLLVLVTSLVLIVVDYYAVQTWNYALLFLAITLTYIAGAGLLLAVRVTSKMIQFREQWNQEHGTNV